MQPDKNLTTEETTLPGLAGLLTLCRKETKLPYYIQALGSAEDKDQTAWLIALEISAEFEPRELQIALTGTDHFTHKKLRELVYAYIKKACTNNGFKRHDFKVNEFHHSSAWLPEAITFTEYLARDGQTEQSEENLATITSPMAVSNAWDWEELQPKQDAAPAKQPNIVINSSPLPLTPREYEVMVVFLVPEANQEEAAKYLQMSRHTLKYHLDSVYRKFQVHSIKDARSKFIEMYQLEDLVALAS